MTAISFWNRNHTDRHLSSVYTFYHAHGKSLHFDRETQANINQIGSLCLVFRWIWHYVPTTNSRRAAAASRASATMAAPDAPLCHAWDGTSRRWKATATAKRRKSSRPHGESMLKNACSTSSGECRKVDQKRNFAELQTYTIDNMTCWQLWRQEDLFDWPFKRIPATPQRREAIFCVVDGAELQRFSFPWLNVVSTSRSIRVLGDASWWCPRCG